MFASLRLRHLGLATTYYTRRKDRSRSEQCSYVYCTTLGINYLLFYAYYLVICDTLTMKYCAILLSYGFFFISHHGNNNLLKKVHDIMVKIPEFRLKSETCINTRIEYNHFFYIIDVVTLIILKKNCSNRYFVTPTCVISASFP